MSKKTPITPVDIETTVMHKVTSNEIAMKPRWYYMLGSIAMIAGLTASSVGAVFLINLTFFLLRQHGPMGQWRLQLILASFPIWIPAVALCGIFLGALLLKQYDFSYKKNYWLIITSFVTSIILAAFALDHFGLNDVWFKTGPMRRFYNQQFENQRQSVPRGGQGNGWRRNVPNP